MYGNLQLGIVWKIAFSAQKYISAFYGVTVRELLPKLKTLFENLFQIREMTAGGSSDPGVASLTKIVCNFLTIGQIKKLR